MARVKPERKNVERGITQFIRTYPDGRKVETFQIRYGDGNGGMLTQTFSTKAKARAALARARTQVMDGDHINPGSADTKFLTVAHDWVAAHPNWKERTRRANEWTIAKKLAPLHSKRMKQLTTETVYSFRVGLMTTPTERGTLPAASSVNRTMGVLYAICEHARLKRHIAVNPCADVPSVKSESLEVVPPTMKEVQALIRRIGEPTPERLDSLGRRWKERPADPRWAVLVEVAAWTGLRAGELAGLKKADLDFESGTLTVRRTIIDTKGGLREDTPKSARSRRIIELGGQVTRLLWKFTEKMKRSDYVFGVGDRPLRHNQFQGRFFRPAVDDLGLPMTFHDLRHFHASVLIASGMDVVAVSRRLGHADSSITLKRYAHLFRLRESNDGARIDAIRDAANGLSPKKLRPKVKKQF